MTPPRDRRGRWLPRNLDIFRDLRELFDFGAELDGQLGAAPLPREEPPAAPAGGGREGRVSLANARESIHGRRGAASKPGGGADHPHPSPEARSAAGPRTGGGGE